MKRLKIHCLVLGELKMKYRKFENENILKLYKSYYSSIDGGIDGYYEKTILDADVYEVYENQPLAYFSVYPERGLTSLFVLNDSQTVYDKVFDFVISLSLFQKMLFSENDKRFFDAIKKRRIPYEIQAYNFISGKDIVPSIKMKLVSSGDYAQIKKEFGEFIIYNDIQLEMTQSFIYEVEGKLISFAAIEPLRLNDKRYCISMIVNEEYRRRGVGQDTVKFLIDFLHSHNLEPNARCYVLNEASKRTLIRSGMLISNHLYKVGEIKYFLHETTKNP